jgi:ABC-type lipoprotein export system ATPase subunit
MAVIGSETASGSLVDATGVSRRYGEGEAAVDALAEVTVGFPTKRFAAIMGPSGSGKSTLMHILAGLDRPTSGTVSIDGVELTGLDDKKLTKLRRDRIGFIFQTFNLLPVLSAEENILLPLSIAGREPDKEWFSRLVETVGIADRPSCPAVSSSEWPSPARSSRARPSCSPTSRPETSTPRRPTTFSRCCATPSTTSARRS